jgi:type II secretory pathway pseudopilin PulG
MQRKSHILKTKRSGMAIIMAIAVIVIVATLLALAMSLTTLTTKSSVDLYVYEQANLLARSAGEYARLRIGTDNNATNRCTYTGENFIENTLYNININVSYIYSTGISNCGMIDLTQTDDFGAAQIDITVEVNNPAIASEPIRIFKRKLVEL